jgi:hypothetical protein
MSSSPPPPPEKKVKLSDSDNKDEIKSLRDQIIVLKEAIASQEAVMESKDKTIESKDEIIAFKDEVIKLFAEAEQNEKSISEFKALCILAALFRETCPISPLKCIGRSQSDTEPHNYIVAKVQMKSFDLQYLYPALTNELKEYNLNLEEHPSPTILTCTDSTVRDFPEFQMIVRSTLSDVIYICNKILTSMAKKHDLSNPIQLFVTAGFNLFSNIPDHLVIADVNSLIPILAIDAEMFCIANVTLNETSHGMSNAIMSKCLEQLLSMSLMGHPRPFGAITCHNWTRVTWLDSRSHQEIINHHHKKGYSEKRIMNIIKQLSNSVLQKKRSVCSETKSISSSKRNSSHDFGSFPADRSINISELSYSQDKLIDLYVNAVFCSLEGLSQPQNTICWEINGRIIVQDSVGITKDTHVWTNVDTTYQGPLTLRQRMNDSNSMIYLIQYIGHGSSSRVYRGITSSGYDCVVKVYVPFKWDDGQDMDGDEFEKYSEEMAIKEEANYKVIYDKSVLDGYVWREILNGLQCIIMPFFEPVKVEQQSNPVVLDAIENQLQRFCHVKKMYLKCEQSWRHVGYFHNQIVLYDLGRLIDIDHPPSDDEDYYSEPDVATAAGGNDIQIYIAYHLARLSKETDRLLKKCA